MRIPLLSRFRSSPLDGLLAHAEKIKECTWAFQQAIECHINDQCKSFEEFRLEVDRLKNEAASVKRHASGHLPKEILMPIDKFELYRYLHEQDKVLEAVEDALDWLSFRSEHGIPKALEKDFYLLVDAVLDPVEEMCRMVSEAQKYFSTFSGKQRRLVEDIIHTLCQQEHAADKVENAIKQKVLNMTIEPVIIFHMIRLAETIGSIADHAENAGDMMRAMLAR